MRFLKHSFLDLNMDFFVCNKPRTTPAENLAPFSFCFCFVFLWWWNVLETGINQCQQKKKRKEKKRKKVLNALYHFVILSFLFINTLLLLQSNHNVVTNRRPFQQRRDRLDVPGRPPRRRRIARLPIIRQTNQALYQGWVACQINRVLWKHQYWTHVLVC